MRFGVASPSLLAAFPDGPAVLVMALREEEEAFLALFIEDGPGPALILMSGERGASFLGLAFDSGTSLLLRWLLIFFGLGGSTSSSALTRLLRRLLESGGPVSILTSMLGWVCEVKCEKC